MFFGTSFKEILLLDLIKFESGKSNSSSSGRAKMSAMLFKVNKKSSKYIPKLEGI